MSSLAEVLHTGTAALGAGWHGDAVHVFELEPEDVCYLPAGSRHEYRNAGGATARGDLRHRPELPAVTLAVGIDVGGTKVAAALVDVGTGAVADVRRIPTDAGRGLAAVLEDCVSLASSLAADRSVAGVGLAVCKRGRSRAQRGDRRLARGRPRRHVRLGGAAIRTGAPLVEHWSGGLALARLSGHASAQEALADPAAADVVEEGARRLGLAVAALVNALDPGALAVGGGPGLHERYRGLAIAAMREAIYDPAAREVPVLPAALGADAAVIGAALGAAR
jgi:predicted NBD/HSP70 family sugar kinase